MLIKIANAPYFEDSTQNSFTIFDKVDIINYCQTQPQEYSTNEALSRLIDTAEGKIPCIRSYKVDIEKSIFDYMRIRDFIGTENSCLAQPLEQLSDNYIYRINYITFEKEGKVYLVHFDTIAYICNDEGKTLEKSFAGGVGLVK